MLLRVTINQIWLHIIVGLLCLVGYTYGGNLFELAVIPYVLWMVFKKSSIYLPALCIHLITGSLVMYVIYGAIAILTILNYNELSKFRLKWLLKLLLLITPVLFIFLISLIVNYKTDFRAYIRVGPFLTLFSFFYGALISHDMNRKVLNSLLWLMLFFIFIHFSEWIQIRLVFFAIPLFCSLSLLFFFSRKGNRLISAVALGFLTFYLFTFNNSTLTIFLSVVVSSLFSMMYLKHSRILTARLFWILPFTLIAFVMIWGISNFSTYNPTSLSTEDEITVHKSEKLVNRFEFKLMEDRSPFWAAGISQIIDEAIFLPPMVLKDVKGEFANKRKFEITFGAHNLYIDVLRYYGLIPGTIVILVYISIIIKTFQVYSFTNLDPTLVILVSTALAINIVGSIAGLLPILPQFALIGLAISGITFALTRSTEMPT